MNTDSKAKTIALALVVIVACSSAGAQIRLAEKKQPKPAEWSAHATYLGYGLGALDNPGELKVRRVAGPDGKCNATFEQYQVVVSCGGLRLPGASNWSFSTLAEVLWSPDAKAFAITSSDGGWVGSWDLEVFALENGAVVKWDIAKKVRADAIQGTKCRDRSYRNIAAVDWVGDSKKLLVVAEVPPVSDCPDMGKLLGYVVSVPSGDIVNRMTEHELRSRHGRSLGDRIRK